MYHLEMITDGTYLKSALEALKLSPEEARETTKNSEEIVKELILAYGGNIATGIDPTVAPSSPLTGLIYGRIQSGKTRAMIASTAMAFDNNFKIVIVMTSNINDLVNQTHFDFSTGLQGVMTFT